MFEVQRRFTDVQGRFAASAITLTAFLSLFPLLLVTISVFGFLAGSNANLGNQIIDTLGLTGPAADAALRTLDTAQTSARAGSIIGLVGMAWTGLNLVAALKHGVDVAWQARSTQMRGKLLGLPWLLGTAVLVAASFVASTLFAWSPTWTGRFAIIISLAFDFALFLWTFRLLGTAKVGWRPLIPGAIFGAIGFEILKLGGTLLLPYLVKNSSAVYGSLGVVFAVLAWLVLVGRLFVYSSIINVVRYEHQAGTVTLVIQAPNVPDDTAVATTRGGTVEVLELDDPPEPADDSHTTPT